MSFLLHLHVLDKTLIEIEMTLREGAADGSFGPIQRPIDKMATSYQKEDAK